MSTVSHREVPDLARPLPAPGRYRHFKGGEYELLRVGRHTEDEELVVIYFAVGDPETVWVRPLEMFTDVIEIDDVVLPRFERCAEPISYDARRLVEDLLSAAKDAVRSGGAYRRLMSTPPRRLARRLVRSGRSRPRASATADEA